jgi:hypothetical protein
MQGDGGLMHLLSTSQDERAGYPSASEYDRLLQCRASYLLSRKAHALGRVAHQWSPAADLGTRKHLANVDGPEILSDQEREDWETVQPKREEFIKGWLGPSQGPFSSTKEEHLWLRRGMRTQQGDFVETELESLLLAANAPAQVLGVPARESQGQPPPGAPPRRPAGAARTGPPPGSLHVNLFSALHLPDFLVVSITGTCSA